MAWLRVLIVLFMLITICYCQCHINSAGGNCHKKKKKHHHDLWFLKGSILSYYAFLILKIKAFFVFGTIFAIGLALGKFFALLKFTEYMKKKYHPHEDHHDHYHHADEKVVFSDPYKQGEGFPGYKRVGYAGAGYQSYQQYPPGYSVDQPPPPVSNFGQNNFGGSARNDDKDDGLYDKFKEFTRMLERMNTTELVFKEMNIESDVCKRKVICELEFKTRQSLILQTALNMVSDESLAQYQTNSTIANINQCKELYASCNEDDNDNANEED